MSTFATQATPDAGGPSGARIDVHVNRHPSSVAVVLRHDDLQSAAQLKQSLRDTEALRDPLRRHGPQWEPCDVYGKTLQYPVRLDALQRGLVLAKPGDRLSFRFAENIVVRHHFKSITEQQNKFAAEGGKEPAHHLFCEFFDNSIESLLRTRCARPDAWGGRPPPPIELHLVYSSDPAHRGKLEHIAVLDFGSGLNEQELKGWAEPNKPADERAAVIRGASALSAQLEELSTKLNSKEPPFHADGKLGIFGFGSKQAGFY